MPQTSLLEKIFAQGTGGIGAFDPDRQAGLDMRHLLGVTLACWAGMSRAAEYQKTAITSPMTAET